MKGDSNKEDDNKQDGPSELEERFLIGMQKSHEITLASEHGSRSPLRLVPIHGFVIDELKDRLGAEFSFEGYRSGQQAGQERQLEGKYYAKNVDVAISRGQECVGVVSVKSVVSSYSKNAINYFEQQLGETANLKGLNIVYGNLFCVTNPLPTKIEDDDVTTEVIKAHHLDKYKRLMQDHSLPHVPDAMAFCIFDREVSADPTKDSILGISDFGNIEGLSPEDRQFFLEKMGIERFFASMELAIQLKTSTT